MRSLQVLPRSKHILSDLKHAIQPNAFESNQQRSFLIKKGGSRGKLSSSLLLEHELSFVQSFRELFIDSSLLGDSSLCNWNQDNKFLEAKEGLPISEYKLIKTQKGKDQRNRSTELKKCFSERFKNLIAKEDF